MSKPRRPRQLDAREERIRAYLEDLLQVPVVQHDDGTEDGMYDLTIERPTSSEAVEIVSDASPEMRSSMSARKRLPGQIQCPGLLGGWRVRPRNHVTVKWLDARIATALRALEDAGVADMAVAHGPALKAATDAGIHSAQRDPTLGAGDVRVIAAIVTGGSVGLIDEVIDLVAEALGQSPDVAGQAQNEW